MRERTLRFISSKRRTPRASRRVPAPAGDTPATITPEAIAALGRLLSQVSIPENRRDTILTANILTHARDWEFDCEMRGHTPATISSRRIATERLHWFCAHSNFEQCGPRALKQFFAYLQHAHELPGGRWGHNATSGRFCQPLSPRTVRKTYWNHLHTYFAWLVQDKTLDVSPLAEISPPECRRNQVQPFSTEEIKALLAAAQKGRNELRDRAIILVLLDTGLRASELCSLTGC